MLEGCTSRKARMSIPDEGIHRRSTDDVDAGYRFFSEQHSGRHFGQYTKCVQVKGNPYGEPRASSLRIGKVAICRIRLWSSRRQARTFTRGSSPKSYHAALWDRHRTLHLLQIQDHEKRKHRLGADNLGRQSSRLSRERWPRLHAGTTLVCFDGPGDPNG